MPDNPEDLSSQERRFGKSFFEDGRVNESDKLLTALRDAKPSFLTDGRGIRGPDTDLQAAERRYGDTFFKRTDADRGSVRREPKQPAFPPVDSVSETQAVIRRLTPFFVSKSTGAGGVTVLKVYPGKIAGIVPTINGVKLDNNPTPSQSLGGATAPFSLFLRAKITVDADNLFRSFISEVAVRTDNDPIVTPDIDGGTGEVPELKVIWDDGGTHQVGHFYIKICDVTVNGAGQVTKLIQWLFDSYSSFVTAGTEVVILV